MKSNRFSGNAETDKRGVVLLTQAKLVQRLLDSFEPPKSGVRSAHLVANSRLMAVRKFPLPDRFLPEDDIDFLIDLDPVPAGPPVGLHAVEKGNLATIQEIKRALGGHVFDAERGLYGTHQFKGGIWICHHYAGNQWRFNASAPERGDNIAKFLETLYARLM